MEYCYRNAKGERGYTNKEIWQGGYAYVPVSKTDSLIDENTSTSLSAGLQAVQDIITSHPCKISDRTVYVKMKI
ncbi:hypothetical protein [Nodularia sp. UHCC 0506]|uniref:hypothetical protein n=1 Tax=Nodularia sp. UHCC 0506 TaxID=3110243 RepID=UPI002B21C5C7|nr:hypothetical protein [Nodularia sp. UHCC 0506]MEA5515305.1 hypothetical protein [Nodularia sp. UHCC 0506]